MYPSTNTSVFAYLKFTTFVCYVPGAVGHNDLRNISHLTSTGFPGELTYLQVGFGR